MAQVIIDIPDQYANRVVDALCAMGHWTPELGMSKNAFAKSEVQRMIKEHVLAYERRLAEAAIPDPPALEM